MTASPALFQQAVSLFQNGRLAQAAAVCDGVLKASINQPDWLHLRGVIALREGRYPQAIADIEQAVSLNPGNPHFHNNLGNAYKRQHNLSHALACYERALALQGDVAEFHYNRGGALADLGHLDDALASYDRALALNPGYGPAWNNRGKVLHAMNRLDDALASTRQAVALMPGSAEALANLATVLDALKRFAEALVYWQRVILLSPSIEFGIGNVAHTRAYLCDWGGHAEQLNALQEGLWAGADVASPFPLLALLDDPQLQRRAAEIYAKKIVCRGQANAEANHGAIPVKECRDRPLGETVRNASGSAPLPSHDKIRVAYLSADFHDHATTRLAAELFELHDKNRFEIIAISFGPSCADAMRQRLVAAFDRFIDVRLMSDADVVGLCRQLAIDIAVDLKGYTQGARPGILAGRCAPVQVSYLGYPGTMGAPFIDYIVADHVLITPDNVSYYAEKVIWLPDSYQINDRQRAVPSLRPTRSACGLPENVVVFCCFNSLYKVTPATFDGWMRILAQVPDSVLWLLEGNPAARANLVREARVRGIQPDRLVFARSLPLPDHLARLSLADLFLDTLPCNAHTTASDALWVGVPVLTCAGRSFAARVAASVLRAVGLDQLIVATPANYEALAVTLAQQPKQLAQIKNYLTENRLHFPLFDTPRYVRHLESAFVKIVERFRAGLGPDHVVVAASRATD